VNTKAWRNALKRAGIAEFRWHYLRHTWASWLIQNCMPLYDLQEMGDWKSAAMVRRYAHMAPAHMARHAAVVDGLLRVSSTAQWVKEWTATNTKKASRFLVTPSLQQQILGRPCGIRTCDQRIKSA
jgi:hypothetical protein